MVQPPENYPTDLRVHWSMTGTDTVTLSPDGEGKNGVPSGKPFYAVLRAYVPVAGADMAIKIETR
ncbi:MAG TPA: hypothetical protein EYG52_05995 [Pseudomonadales bacterium]|nr:hypothetical protein [Gammaproteobacteria bacterium]HIL83048.1 hypothetical protein [Pseudomonadales bacterium]